ncbi:MAG: hypothetical protein WC627_10025 [Legionella sp.]|jgi:hypothetical protein
MINDEIVEVFFSLVAKQAKNNTNPLASAANMLMQHYIKYLYDLEGNNTIGSISSLTGQISLFKNQPGFSTEQLNEIIQDISLQGTAHKAMITEDRDIIERLYVIAQSNYSLEKQALPAHMRTGTNYYYKQTLKTTDTNQPYQINASNNINGLGFFTNVEQFLQLEETVEQRYSNYLNRNPQFLALPDEIKELIKLHLIDTKNFMELHGLTYRHLNQVKPSTLSILFSSAKVIYTYAAKGLSVQDLIGIEDKKLSLLLNHPAGLLVLISHKIALSHIAAFEYDTISLVLKAPKKMTRLMDSNIPFDQIALLSYKDLETLLIKNPSPEGIAIENQLKLAAEKSIGHTIEFCK